MVAGRELAPMRISVRIGFGLAFTIIGTTAFVFLNEAASAAENAERLTHAQDLEDELHAVVFALYAAETAQWEFAATGRPLSVGQA